MGPGDFDIFLKETLLMIDMIVWLIVPWGRGFGYLLEALKETLMTVWLIPHDM